MPEIVYRATETATSIYETTYKQALEARKAAIAEFLGAHGFDPDTSVYAHDEGTGRVIGVRHDGPAPAGWRIDRQHPGSIVPALRTRHGKSIDKDMAKIPHAYARRMLTGGMPDRCIAGRVLMHPSVETLGDHLYVGWPRELPEKTETRIDGTVWQEIPLSVYHLARERAQEQEASDV